MKTLKFLLFFYSLLIFVPQAWAQSSSTPELLVVVFGDQLTANSYLPRDKRFSAQLEKKLKDIGFVVNVLNVSQTDMTSAEANEKLNSIFAKSPDLIIFQIGEADIKRSFPPNSILNNIVNMVDSVKRKGIYPIVMGTNAPASRGVDYVYEINEGFNRIGKLYAQLYPYTLAGVDGRPEYTIGDGYHPNAQGVALMVEGIYRYVDMGLRWKLNITNKMLIQNQLNTEQ